MRRILWVLSIFATIEALGIIISIGFSAQASGAQNQNWTNYNINATNADLKILNEKRNSLSWIEIFEQQKLELIAQLID